MDGFTVAGAASLGIVVGWLIRYFIRRFKRFTPQALTAVISAAVGGGILKLLTVDEHAIWSYFIGLLLGFVIYHLIFVLERRYEHRVGADDAATEPTPPPGRYSGDGALFGNKNFPGNSDKQL